VFFVNTVNGVVLAVWLVTLTVVKHFYATMLLSPWTRK